MHSWPHSPPHHLTSAGAYMVTSGTYRWLPFFRSPQRLTYLSEQLLSLALRYEWQLQAWAVFPNHYHFVATTSRAGIFLPKFIAHLHTVTAKEINSQDQTPGRKVWFQYWDSQLTYQRSYLARLRYVHCNAMHHGLVREITQYQWCSAAWFLHTAPRSFFQTTMNMSADRLKVLDDFTISPEDVQ